LVEQDGALLLASSLDGDWNNFPTHGAFLPLVHQSVEALLERKGGGDILVGQQVTLVVDRGAVPSGAEIVCRGPGGAELPVRTETTSRGLLLKTKPASIPGAYSFLAAGRALGQRVVNVDTENESNLSVMEIADIKGLFPDRQVQVLAAGDPVAGAVREARYGREFWKELVAIALLALMVESLLSRRGVA
jgi:hypothetical protein